MDRPRHLRLVATEAPAPEGPSDAALLALAANGKQVAFAQLLHRHATSVAGFAGVVAGNGPRAREAARDALLALWSARHHLGADVPMRAWLLGRTRVATQSWRPRLALREGLERLVGATPPPEVPEGASGISRQEWAFRRLDPVDRGLLVLKLVERLDDDAISRILAIPANQPTPLAQAALATWEELLAPARTGPAVSDSQEKQPDSEPCPTSTRLAAIVLHGAADAPVEHVGGCAACRVRVETLRQLVRKLPELVALSGPESEESLIEATLHRVHAQPTPRRVIASAVALAVACVVGLLALFVRGPNEEPAWAAQEALGPLSEAVTPVWATDGGPLPEGAALSPDAPLRLLLDNRSPEPLHAMVVAFDAEGRLHWLAPTYVDPAFDPVSLPIPAARKHLLPDVRLPEGAVGPWTLAVLLSRTPRTVRQVAGALSLVDGADLARVAQLLGETSVRFHPVVVLQPSAP